MTNSKKTNQLLSKEKVERIIFLQEKKSDRTPEEVEELEGLEEEQMAAEIAAEELTKEAPEDKVNREKKEASEKALAIQAIADKKILDEEQAEADEESDEADKMVKANLNDEFEIREIEARDFYHFNVMNLVKRKGQKKYDEIFKVIPIGTRTFDKFDKLHKKDGVNLFLGYDSVELIHDPIKYIKENPKK